MSETVEYRLRNEPEKFFKIAASAEGSGAKGATVRATVTRHDNHVFRYEVIFEGDFTSTKQNFNEEMYLGTGLSVVKSQLESHLHQDTRIRIRHASGLMQTEHPAKLDWGEL
ncbi:MAG: hypothetical protein AB7S38_02780 [Vulcanimicrobiota bacterium]